ncbi:MAG TPA: DUF2071 domain-containing protein [Solirubrobacteraceae bacterium]
MVAGRIADAAEALVAPLSPTAARQAAVLDDQAHRPWPVPEGPWLMGQTWLDLAFLHWPVDPAVLRPAVPSTLPLDEHDGAAWIGVTPFEILGLRLHGAPPLPGLSRFGETNVRTYVTVDGKPGIYFLSLDAARAAAVQAARRSYRLPYFHAAITIAREDGGIHYRLRRDDATQLTVDYRPTGPPQPPAPGSLAYFLTERDCLYTLDEELRPLRADIHHPRWPLQPADAEITANTMLASYGITLEGAPIVHFSARQDVVIWSLG